MKKWTNVELNEIISLIKDGKNYDEISVIYGRTKKSIRCKVNKYGIKISDFKIYKKDIVKYCLNCDEEISNEKTFCNNKCSAEFNNKLREKKTKSNCILCGKEVNKNGNVYCSHKCQHNYEYEKYINKWKNGEEDGKRGECQISHYIKRYIFEKYDNKCSKCGWGIKNEFTGNIPLEIEHIDGNSQNNTEENLTLLCPNCHSLTKTYKGANKGNGRHNRMKRYYDGKSY